MDFLGLKNLTVIYEACSLVKRNHNIELDLTLPLDDHETYELLARGDTIGFFNLNQEACEKLSQVVPDCIEDVIAIVALFHLDRCNS